MRDQSWRIHFQVGWQVAGDPSSLSHGSHIGLFGCPPPWQLTFPGTSDLRREAETTISYDQALEVTHCHFLSIPLFICIISVQYRKGLHKGFGTRRWGSLGATKQNTHELTTKTKKLYTSDNLQLPMCPFLATVLPLWYL